MMGGEEKSPGLTRDQVIAVIGERDEATIAAIVASEACIEDVSDALALAEGSSDTKGEREHAVVFQHPVR